MKSTTNHFKWRFCFAAVALVATAAALRLWPMQVLGTRMAWLTFYPAVTVAALYGGFVAGLLATSLSCLAVLLLLPGFVGQPMIKDSADWLGLAVFAVTSMAIAGIAGGMRRARVRERLANVRSTAAETELAQLNAELRDRAAQLEAANKELESFAYSVSHDLRSPLRSMDGFSQALLEDYAGQLDATGQDYLRRIRAASQRMDQLIDDLLNLSQVTRSAMALDPVNLTALARKAIAELQPQQAGRAVQWEVSDPLTGRGDSRLLQLVLENLLANALKFTGKCEHARIEFGRQAQGAEQTFFVRDNGVGFDMAYANRLFGAFQRLHTPAEFPGTGIGLATVQRIIHRHGGRVWAEAEPARGATFYFTLPTPQ